MIEDFGSYLKSERELRGVPLEEISTNTKIPIRFLQALENNQFDQLPGEVFIKGYIRSFAKVIGFDENEMLSVYDETKHKPSPNEQIEGAPVDGKISKDNIFIYGLILTIIFLVGIGWGLNILIQKPTPMALKPDQREVKKSLDPATLIEDDLSLSKETDKLSGTSKTTTESKNQKENPSEKLIPSVENFSGVETKENSVLEIKEDPDITADLSNIKMSDGTSDSASETNVPLNLTIKVRDNVWLNITVDGARTEDFILPKGAEKIFYGKDSFQITLGNRNAVDLKLNGKALNLPNGDTNNMVREFIINSKLIESTNKVKNTADPLLH